MSRKTILILAYSVSPTRGSEYAVAWDHINTLSQDHDLIVIYGLAGDHMGDLQEIEGSAQAQALPNVEWVGVRPNRLARLLNAPNRKGFLVYSFYLAYQVWHRQAYQAARAIVARRPVDLVHYLCPIGFREPGYLWQLDRPYIWGPVGGVQNRSVALAAGKGWRVGLKVLLRNLVNSAQFRLSARLARAARRADLLVASTTYTQRALARRFGVAVQWMPENAMADAMLAAQRVATVAPGQALQLIWVGRIDEAKSLDILLQALGRVVGEAWQLTVVGDGPARAASEQLAATLGLQGRIRWAGRVPRAQVDAHWSVAHVHVISSLLEANTTVIWEAMSHGLPTLSLDHFGMHDTICDRCGVRVSATHLPTTIDELAQAVRALARQPERVATLSRGVAECSRQFTWHARRELWNRHYGEVMDRWHSGQHGGRQERPS